MADRQHDAGSKIEGAGMTDRYTVINRDTLEAMRRAGHVAKLEARIEKLETALTHIYAWYPVSIFNPHQTIKEIKEFACKALEGKDD